MEEYTKRVERVARERKGEPVANGSIEHARIVIEHLFLNAKNTVSIFSGKLNPEVYGVDSVVKASETFLKGSDRKLEIILEHGDISEDSQHLLSKWSGFSQFKKKVLSPELCEKVGYHLIVVDDDCYRFEHDKTKSAAVAAWGDKDGARHLSNIFGLLWAATQ